MDGSSKWFNTRSTDPAQHRYQPRVTVARVMRDDFKKMICEKSGLMWNFG